ncbi:MAG: hypothetical protein KatS3mg023_3604 [Armatimonadota bacterium]|nr:MAG: hypothetical protein KatS3mg023_3604 [Armatimonadota bacterium]
MRPIIQMIFTVQEVRQLDNGTLYVRGYTIAGRDQNGNTNFASVTVFIPDTAQHMLDAAMSLEVKQRVFVMGALSTDTYIGKNNDVRIRYTVNYPQAFIPLDVPQAEPVQDEVEDQADSEPVKAEPRRVEMSGTARAVSSVNNGRSRPATFTIPRPQRVAATAQKVEEPDEGDPFADA